jgi:hypothetical protein
MFKDLRKKVIILFVDICGIDDHHCLNVLFIFNLHSWSYTTIHYIIIIKECNGDSTENDGGYRACYEGSVCLFVCLVVFNATFNNISVISWRSVLLVEETGGPRENHRPVASYWQNLSHNVVLSTHRPDQDSNSQHQWW